MLSDAEIITMESTNSH